MIRRPRRARRGRRRARRRRKRRKSHIDRAESRPRLRLLELGADRRSAARSASRIPGALGAVGEHEQTSPRHPAAAHFASVAPQPNSMSSGWAPIARARSGTARSLVATGAVIGRGRRRDPRDRRRRSRALVVDDARQPRPARSAAAQCRANEPGRRRTGREPRPAPRAPGCRRRDGQGTITATVLSSVPSLDVDGDRIERHDAGRSACTTIDARAALLLRPTRARPAAARRAIRGSATTARSRAAAHSTTSGALVTIAVG